MTTQIIPEKDDDGKTVYAWFVMNGDETLGGGYCATESDARNDAQSYMSEVADRAIDALAGLIDEIDRCGVTVSAALESAVRAIVRNTL